MVIPKLNEDKTGTKYSDVDSARKEEINSEISKLQHMLNRLQGKKNKKKRNKVNHRIRELSEESLRIDFKGFGIVKRSFAYKRKKEGRDYEGFAMKEGGIHVYLKCLKTVRFCAYCLKATKTWISCPCKDAYYCKKKC